MTGFVLDTSVTAAWLLPHEHHPVAEHAFSLLETAQVSVPSLWWYEIRNCLIVNERKGKIELWQSQRLLASLSRFSIRSCDDLESDGVTLLARQHSLSVYDAAYLFLAQREGVPLATLDRDLIAAAKKENIRLLAA